MEQKPTQGRIVDFIKSNGETHTAIIVKVWSDDCVNLAAFDHNGAAYNATSVLKMTSETPVTSEGWAWPKRV